MRVGCASGGEALWLLRKEQTGSRLRWVMEREGRVRS